ncbi:hypothetical protein H312_01878 [Anncaliia algerae PRA339]|uniref:Uncharacterized protein n=1 Tax=Anncaliia algerae PRA339 TaxID=1288291 RepID=A0A059F0M3_9MICR|nr:hypothetical protein H312_01878 [Anncaliia algerae PRA339]
MLRDFIRYLKIDYRFLLSFLIRCILARLITIFVLLNIFFILGRMYNKYFWNKLKDKWIVITGCTDGIGKEIAIQLAKRKFKLCLLARNKDKLNELANSLRDNENIKEIVFDLNNDVPQDLFDDLPEIGLLINNAGVSLDFPDFFEDSNVKEIIKINVLTTSLLTKLAIKKMKKGNVIFVSSILAENTAPLLSAYSASKAYIKHLSESLSYENNVHSEVVFPGYVCTKMSKIRKPSLFVPSAKDFAASLIKTIGFSRVTIPYYPHLLINFVYTSIPSWVFGNVLIRKLLNVRKIALKKKKSS